MSEDRATGVETGNSPSELRNLIADTLRDQTVETPAPETAPATPGEQPPSRPGIPATGGLGPPAPAAPAAPAEPPGTGAPPPEPAPTAPPDTTEPPWPAASATAAPQHWAATDKATFNGLPDAAKAPFLALYKRMEGGFQPRLERAATFERDYAEIDQAFAPYREKLRAQGRGPREILQIWYNTESGLANQQTRDQVLANLIHGYGGEPAAIARHLNALRGFAPQPAAGDGGRSVLPAPNGAQSELSPELQARLTALENDTRARLEAEMRNNLTQAQSLYETFAAATDAAGNPLHPFLAELEPQMTMLARLDRETGKQIDLQDLYDRASWANPSTRERLLEQRQSDEQRRAADERKAKAEAARRASSSVAGAPGPGAAPNDLGSSDRSIRDEIKANMTAGGRPNGRI